MIKKIFLKQQLTSIVLIVLSILMCYFVWTKNTKNFQDIEEKIKIDPSKIKIYIVNMDKSKERWNLVHQLLDTLELKHERFRATDGVELAIIDLQTNKKIKLANVKNGTQTIEINKQYLVDCEGYSQLVQFGYNQNKNNISEIKNWNQKSIPGVIGHYCTHIRILNQIFNNDEIAIVLDDDTTTNYDKDEFLKSYNEILSNMPKDWQMLLWFHSDFFERLNLNMLYSQYSLSSNIVQLYPKYFREPRAPLYMVNKAGAEIILNNSQKLYHAYDAVMGFIAISGILKTYYVAEAKKYTLCSLDIQSKKCLDTSPLYGNKIFLPLEFSGRSQRKNVIDVAITNVWH